MCCRTLTFATLLFFTTPFALADSPKPALPELEVQGEDEASEEELPSTEAPLIVITGTRREATLKDTPVAVEVITRKDIEKTHARTAADALQDHPGLIMAQTFRGPGVQLQGLSARHVLILVDGERVTGKKDGQLDLTQFSADAIERIEIVKGASSSLYGSDAIGGVVNLITKKGKRKPEYSVELLYGEFHRTRLSAQGSGRLSKNLGLAVSSTFLHEDAFSVDNTTPATTGTSYDDISSTIRLDWKVLPNLTIDTRIQHLYREQNALDATRLPDDIDGNTRFREVDRTEYFHNLQLKIAPTLLLGAHTLAFSLSGSLSHSVLIEDQRRGDHYDHRETAEELLLVPSVQWNYAIGDHALTAGTEVHLESYEAERINGRYHSRTRFGLYAQDEWRIIKDEDPFDDKFEQALSFIPGLRFDADSQFGMAFSPRVALRYDPLDWLTLRGSFGLGFRAPDFEELYILFSNPAVGYRVEGNPLLKPENSMSTELSFEVTPLNNFSFHLNLFRHDISNLIITSIHPPEVGEPDIYTYYNVETATAQGAEISATYSPYDPLRLKFGYNFTDSRDDKTGKRIVGRATHQITATLYWDLPWDLSLMGQAAVLGPRPYEVSASGNAARVPGLDLPRIEAPWQPLLNLRLSKTLVDHLTLTVAVDNLLDTNDRVTLPIRPRTFFASIKGFY